MIDKSDIKQWLKKNYPNLLGSFGMVNPKSKPLADVIEECFNDLQPQWVSADIHSELIDSALYWVLMPSGRVDMMYFNNYKKFGGVQDHWQDLSGNDYTLENTKCIEIVKPETPK